MVIENHRRAGGNVTPVTRRLPWLDPQWRRSLDQVSVLIEKENAAAAAFESRWTRQALVRADPELEQRLSEQRNLFSWALGTGHDDLILEHGEAMVRGWHAAIKRMADAVVPDDAYLAGEDPASGARVAISAQRSAEARVRERYGDGVIFLTPDEVAAMAAQLQPVGTVKALWPGAEVTAVSQKKRRPKAP